MKQNKTKQACDRRLAAAALARRRDRCAADKPKPSFFATENYKSGMQTDTMPTKELLKKNVFLSD